MEDRPLLTKFAGVIHLPGILLSRSDKTLVTHLCQLVRLAVASQTRLRSSVWRCPSLGTSPPISVRFGWSKGHVDDVRPNHIQYPSQGLPPFAHAQPPKSTILMFKPREKTRQFDPFAVVEARKVQESEGKQTLVPTPTQKMLESFLEGTNFQGGFTEKPTGQPTHFGGSTAKTHLDL